MRTDIYEKHHIHAPSIRPQQEASARHGQLSRRSLRARRRGAVLELRMGRKLFDAERAYSLDSVRRRTYLVGTWERRIGGRNDNRTLGVGHGIQTIPR